MSIVLASLFSVLGIAASATTHSVSRNSAFTGVYPLAERRTTDSLLSLLAMWGALLVSIYILWSLNSWWATILLFFCGLICSGLLIFVLPTSGERKLPVGRAALLTSSIIAVISSILACFIIFQKVL